MANTGNAAKPTASKTTASKTTQAAKPAAAKPSRRGGANRFTPADLTGVTADSGKTGGKAEEPKGDEAQEETVQETAPAPPRAPVDEPTQEHPVNGAAPQPGNGVAHREDPPPPPTFGGFPGAPIYGQQHRQQEHQIPVEPASFLAPPPPVTGYQAKRDTQVIGLRTDKTRVDWWSRNLKIVQGYYDLPDGVIPDIAAQMLVQNFHEVLRAAVHLVHGEDIGPAPQPQQQQQQGR